MSWREALTIRHPSKGTTPALGENARWDVRAAALPHRHKPSKITARLQIGAGIGLVHDAAPWANSSTQDLLAGGYNRTTRGVKHKLGVAGRAKAPTRPREQNTGPRPRARDPSCTPICTLRRCFSWRIATPARVGPLSPRDASANQPHCEFRIRRSRFIHRSRSHHHASSVNDCVGRDEGRRRCSRHQLP